jgi:putative molybdopterin biosynthesis protein
MAENQMDEQGSTAPPEVWTTDEVASKLKVTRRTVQQWINEGKLKALRIGREFRIEAQELEAFKERARQAPPPARKRTTRAVSPNQPSQGGNP